MKTLFRHFLEEKKKFSNDEISENSIIDVKIEAISLFRELGEHFEKELKISIQNNKSPK